MTVIPLHPTRLTLIGDDEVVFHGLARILEDVPSLCVVSPQRYHECPASVDLVLADAWQCQDVATLQTLTAGPCRGQLVLFTWNLSPHTASLGLHLGARGCLSKSLPATVIVDSLLRIAEGEIVVQGVAETAPIVNLVGLSRREAEVLAHIGSGAGNQQIAELMGLSPNTLKTYIRSTYRKIGVDSRSRAVLWVLHNGLPWPAQNTSSRPLSVVGAASDTPPD